jgi:hypothetical protein
MAMEGTRSGVVYLLKHRIDSMVASIREEVILAAQATITQTAPAGVTVYRSREAALAVGQLPAVVISPLTDVPSERGSSLCWLNWTLSLAVDVVTGDALDAAADPILQLVHAALMDGDRALGVTAVHDIIPGPVEFAAANKEQPVGLVRAVYVIQYRTKHADLTESP